MRKIILMLACVGALNGVLYAQLNNLYTSYTTPESRATLYRNLVKSINKNLSRIIGNKRSGLLNFYRISSHGFKKKLKLLLTLFPGVALGFKKARLN